jgi:beta-glucosidase
MELRFPEGFLWGVASSAYQVEGAVAEDGRGLSIWDTFSHTPGKTHHGDTGDVAAGQYHLLEGDLDLMARVGIQAYRFSVAWPRVQPQGSGAVNQPGLDYYRRLVDGLLERSITPVLTLYHWDLPQVLQDEGGWTVRPTAERFAEYASVVHSALGDRARFWITLNEPWVSSWLGYGLGIHAPGLSDQAQALQAAHHHLLGHGLAIQAMRSSGGDHKLGIALNLSPVRPASEEGADRKAARRVDGYLNRYFLDPILRGTYPEDMVELYRPITDFSFVREGDLEVISAPLDFLGVNYYAPLNVEAGRSEAMPAVLEATARVPTGVETTAMGWGIQPDGLTELVLRLHEDYAGVVMYITENGAAFPDYPDPEGRVMDPERIAFLDAHLRALHAAIGRGVDVRGYLVWTIIDNFEWAEGYSKRFGLVYVHYPTLERIPKQSARWYREVIHRNGP